MTLHTEDTQECGRPAVVNSLGFGTVTGINYSWFLNQILSNSTTFEERTLHFLNKYVLPFISPLTWPHVIRILPK